MRSVSNIALRWLIVACLLLVSCSNEDPIMTSSYTTIKASAGASVLAAFWLSADNLVILGYDNAKPMELFYVVERNNEKHLMQLSDDPKCSRYTEYLYPNLLPDGRLGLIKRCGGRYPDRAPYLQDESYLIAYDWNTGATEQILASSLPNPRGIGHYSLNPEMTRGVQEYTGLFGTIFWITPRGSEPITATVKDQQHSWRIDENFWALHDYLPATSAGIARAPAWSPDGEKIAFMASLQAIGREGIDRVKVEWGLYIMTPTSLMPNKILGAIFNVTLMNWAPDSTALLFAGQGDNSEQQGLWLVSALGDQLHLLAEGSVVSMSWSPDSRRVVAVMCLVGDNCDPTQREIRILDVTDLMNTMPR